jgi:propionate catabolism operon transcriptional regulator
MIKITFIIPYSDIWDKVQGFLKEVNEKGIIFETVHMVGTQVDPLEMKDSDIIVARGVTYLTLKKKFKDVSMIEIAVTGYDIIRAVNECKKRYNPSKIAIIGSESIIYEIDDLAEILNVKIEVYKIRNEEDAQCALVKAKESGADAIVAGLTAYEMGQKEGWPCALIKTGEEAIRLAIKAALNAAHVVQTERAKAELVKVILDNTKDGIVAVDREGIITAINRAAYKTFKIPKTQDLKGTHVNGVMSDTDFLRVMESGEEELGVIKTINDTMVASDHIPIKVESQNVGAVCTFQNVAKIQEIESKVRKEMSSKGLVAKYSFGNIVGKSKELNVAIQTAYKYSKVDSNILIIGETGTGKELFAQSIHNTSNRSIQPFVAINCAAVPENLLESELFGYVEGAFSGAVKGGKIGLFELAHNGTIFLDEISELPYNLQAKLLRVLQEKEIRRIGGNKVVPVDVRIISAANIELKEKVKLGQFRQDLLYRLDVLSLKIPPLRKRGEDIENIAKYHIDRYCKQYDKSVPVMTSEAIEELRNYSWPGNIRELRNICERLVVLTEKDVIQRADVRNLLDMYDQQIDNDKTEISTKENSIANEENMDDLLKLMKLVKVNKTDMANVLGMSRTTLWRRLKEK